MPRKRSTRLPKRRLAELRGNLQAEEARIMETARATVHLSMSRENQIGDEGDESAEEVWRSDEMRLRDRERNKLRKIRTALARIEAGDYNECEECGEPIGYERLQARPVATRCIACKQEQEREERLRAEFDRAPRLAGPR